MSCPYRKEAVYSCMGCPKFKEEFKDGKEQFYCEIKRESQNDNQKSSS